MVLPKNWDVIRILGDDCLDGLLWSPTGLSQICLDLQELELQVLVLVAVVLDKVCTEVDGFWGFYVRALQVCLVDMVLNLILNSQLAKRHLETMDRGHET